MLEYRTARWPEKELVRSQSREKALNRVTKFVGDDHGRVRTKGRTRFGSFVRPRLAVAKVERRVEAMPLGEVLVIQRQGDREQLSLMKMEIDVAADLGCHPMLEIAHAFWWKNFDVRSGGRWYCRLVDGTNTVSRHGFWLPGANGWKGSAEDVFVNSGGMEAQEEMADATVREYKNDGLIECISNRRIWTPSRGWHGYGGHPHYHKHSAFNGGIACRP